MMDKDRDIAAENGDIDANSHLSMYILKYTNPCHANSGLLLLEGVKQCGVLLTFHS